MEGSNQPERILTLINQMDTLLSKGKKHCEFIFMIN